MSWAPSRTWRNAARSRGISGPYSALTSTSGIVCTRRHFSRSQPPVDQIRQRDQDARNDRVLDVVEAVVEAAIALAVPVARAGEGERPDRRAHEGQHRVDPERHLEDSGRDRDEGADNRSDPADEDAERPPAVEPRLGSVEACGREMEPAAVALEQRPSSPASNRPADERAGEVTERPRQRERD